MVTCPRGLAVGTCCAIQKNGAVFVQEINACRDAVRRVAISKSSGGGATAMTTVEEWQKINLRKVASMLNQQLAKTLQRDHPELKLTDAQAEVKVWEQYPRLRAVYDEGHRRGDAPEELIPPPAPVVKAGMSKAEILETIRKRAEPIAAAQKITMDQAVVNVVCETPEGKQLYQAYCAATS